MAQAQDATLQHLTERRCWEVACTDDMRVERRLYHKLVIEGVNRRDEGALLDDCFPLLPALGVVTLVEHACGTAIPRAMRPFIQSVLRYGRQTLLGIERMHALPS
jgi:hypothetical protein